MAIGNHAACRTGAAAAGCTLAGTLASAPVAMFIVHATYPQPDWQNAHVFAEHYHPIQSLPFFCGFLLVCGFVLLIASLHVLAPERLRVRTQAAVIFTSVFAALVLLNYALQTTFVPSLAAGYVDANGPLLSAFTMANPRSIAWSLEMWGYAWLRRRDMARIPGVHAVGPRARRDGMDVRGKRADDESSARFGLHSTRAG